MASSDNILRVWRRNDEERADWHISFGSEAPLNFIRSVVSPGSFHSPGGLTWDEALETLARLMIAPGACFPLLRFLEPPLSGGWDLVMELAPSGLAEWRVTSRSRDWDRLQLGEAIATFVHETYNRDWCGFRSGRRDSLALQLVVS